MKIYIYIIFIYNVLNACAVCYGAPNDPITIGLNKAILFLLLTIIFVLGCILISIIKFIRKSNEIEA